MAQNAQFLQQLGVKQAKKNVFGGGKTAAKPSKTVKRSREGDDGALPVMRRSRRLAEEKEVLELKRKIQEAWEDSDEDDEPELQYEQSSVFRYTCSSTSVRVGDLRPYKPRAGSRSLVGFRDSSAAADTYQDPALKKIYTISFSPFQENALIATGGHQGHVSVYPSVPRERQDADATAPLMSFQAHHGWVSCLSLTRSTPNGKNLLMSAANDSVLKLWDLNQSNDATPKELMASRGLHRSGINGMDVLGDQVVTCSKDSTIALSLFGKGDGLFSVQCRYEDHSGVVKSVRFSALKRSCFASGGSDRVVRVYDARMKNARASQEIHDAHVRVINSVSWHPTQEHLLLTASYDPEMHLYDLRRPGKPLVAIDTSPSSPEHGFSIFHPCFVANGEFVASTGAATQDKLSLYRTIDGTPVSTASLPTRATSIAVDPFADRLLVAVKSSLQPYDLEWK